MWNRTHRVVVVPSDHVHPDIISQVSFLSSLYITLPSFLLLKLAEFEKAYAFFSIAVWK